MAKQLIELKAKEAAALHKELLRFVKNPINHLVKFHIHQNIETLSGDCTSFETVKNELISKYAEEVEVDGTMQMAIPHTIEEEGKDVPNPSYHQFLEELKPLEDNITSYSLHLISDTVLESITNDSYYYKNIYQFLVKETEQ